MNNIYIYIYNSLFPYETFLFLFKITILYTCIYANQLP